MVVDFFKEKEMQYNITAGQFIKEIIFPSSYVVSFHKIRLHQPVYLSQVEIMI